MTAIDNTPANKNFLSPLNFRFQIKKAPHINFFLQTVNLPEISLPVPEQANPFINIGQTGDHMKYGDLKISFRVDEQLEDYLEIANWIRALGFPENHEEYREIQDHPHWTGDGIRSDISLLIHNSAKMPNFDVTYVDAFPIALSGLEFTTMDSTVNYIAASATFRYTYYTITKI